MNFTKESQTVKNYVLLIQAGERTLDQVPNIGKLPSIVAEEIAKTQNKQ